MECISIPNLSGTQMSCWSWVLLSWWCEAWWMAVQSWALIFNWFIARELSLSLSVFIPWAPIHYQMMKHVCPQTSSSF